MHRLPSYHLTKKKIPLNKVNLIAITLLLLSPSSLATPISIDLNTFREETQFKSLIKDNAISRTFDNGGDNPNLQSGSILIDQLIFKDNYSSTLSFISHEDPNSFTIKHIHTVSESEGAKKASSRINLLFRAKEGNKSSLNIGKITGDASVIDSSLKVENYNSINLQELPLHIIQNVVLNNIQTGKIKKISSIADTAQNMPYSPKLLHIINSHLQIESLELNGSNIVKILSDDSENDNSDSNNENPSLVHTSNIDIREININSKSPGLSIKAELYIDSKSHLNSDIINLQGKGAVFAIEGEGIGNTEVPDSSYDNYITVKEALNVTDGARLDFTKYKFIPAGTIDLREIKALNIEQGVVYGLQNHDLIVRNLSIDAWDKKGSSTQFSAKAIIVDQGTLSFSGEKEIADKIVINNGILHLGHKSRENRVNSSQFSNLTVKEFEINNGKIYLSFSNRDADRLTILESAKGSALIFVNPTMENLHFDHDEGVLLIDASKVAADKNVLNLALGSRVSRGIYNYYLNRTKTGEGISWYLSNTEIPSEITPPKDESNGETEDNGSENSGGNHENGNNEGDKENDLPPSTPGKNPGEKPESNDNQNSNQNGNSGEDSGHNNNHPNSNQKSYAVEPNAYLSNHLISNQLFMLTHNDRKYFESDDKFNNSGLWGSIDASFSKFRSDLTNKIDSKVNSYRIRIGKDLIKEENIVFGAMVAYGHASGKSRDTIKHYRADNHLSGFALGIYSSLFFGNNGYIDLWGQYVKTHNRVESQGKGVEKYHSKGALFSIELGNNLALSESTYLKPQMQISYMGIKADNHTAIDGTLYRSNRGNTQLRIGADLATKGLFLEKIDAYAGLHYFHNSRAYTITASNNWHDAHDISIAGGKNHYQIRLGAAVKINKTTLLKGDISHTIGKERYRQTKVNLNFHHNF